jgi:CheY-like chemotaxis protein
MELDLLVADPDPFLCNLYQEFFASRGFSVQTASHALECLAVLRRNAVGILIIDVDLLWGGGDGVLSLMRQDNGIMRVPLVVVSGDESPADLSQMTGLPPSRCLTKPYPFRQLLECLRLNPPVAEEKTGTRNAV